MFKNVTIILPVINETFSLNKTVAIIKKTCDPKDIKEFLIVICNKTTPKSINVCNNIVSKLGKKYKIYNQKLPFIGGAMKEAFYLAQGSHTIMMSSDLETDPNIVQNFICMSKKNPANIITASRWINGKKAFIGYNKIKLISNYIFQKIFSILYKTNLTDLTYGYRLFPTKLIQNIKWKEQKHPFFLETIVKPLKLGVKVLEIPTVWHKRLEGESQNQFFYNFLYLKIAILTIFLNKKNIFTTFNFNNPGNGEFRYNN